MIYCTEKSTLTFNILYIKTITGAIPIVYNVHISKCIWSWAAQNDGQCGGDTEENNARLMRTRLIIVRSAGS